MELKRARYQEVRAQMQPGDIIAFVDESDDSALLANDNYFHWDSKVYIIRNVIENKGHFEIHAKLTGI